MSLTLKTEQNLRKILERDHKKLSEKDHQTILTFFQNQQLNILVVGGTGSGKSSTINALFDINHAKVGMGADPMTMDITQYDMGNLILWDTPGLGDGIEKDKQHKRKIIHKLTEKDDNKNYLIDLILVIFDGSSRDMGTSFELINNVIIPNLGDNPSERIMIAINQADIAYKGPNGWDYNNNTPTDVSYRFLDEKVENVKKRIFSSTNVSVDPIYYCAGYQDDNGQQWPFNLSKLLYMIVQKAPDEKRLALRSNISMERGNWKHSDGREDYNAQTRESFGLGRIVGSIVGFFFGLF